MKTPSAAKIMLLSPVYAHVATLVLFAVITLLAGCQTSPTDQASQTSQAQPERDRTQPLTAQPAEYQQGYMDAVKDIQTLVEPVGLELMIRTKTACEAKYEMKCGLSPDSGYVPLQAANRQETRQSY